MLAGLFVCVYQSHLFEKYFLFPSVNIGYLQESSLSVTEIEMQLDSSGLNQCKDSGFPSKRANFSLGLSNFCRLEEDDDDDDSTQAGEISREFSTLLPLHCLVWVSLAVCPHA